MRIVFLCSSLEPDKDGVGDYVRRLGREVTALGHQVALVAGNDRHISEEKVENNPLQVLRVPIAAPASERRHRCAAFIRDFSPDWVSAQIVVYGWNPRGLPLYLPRWLKGILSPGASLHLMFHELSIGLSPRRPLKECLVGFLQRELVLKRLARLSQVRKVHANIPAYVKILRGWGVLAQALPLFGNIPVIAASTEQKQEWWRQHVPFDRSEFYVAGTFGALRNDVFNVPLMAGLEKKAASLNLRLMVASAGGLGAKGASRLQEARERYGETVEFVELGHLAADEVSIFLQHVDVGIASTPWVYLGKSGSVAAMVDHGLPVLVPCETIITAFAADERSPEYTYAHRVLSARFVPELLASEKHPPRESIAIVARTFVNDLEGNACSE